MKILTSLLILFFGVSVFSNPAISTITENQQDELMEKFHNAILRAYSVENFDLEEIAVPSAIAENLPVEANHKNFFRIMADGNLIGYSYLGEAASKEHMYDYAVFFDTEFIIKKSKVLIYREEFGRQIGTRRWLDQFKGMNAENRPKYGENIAAISGATISATSMTRAVNNVLESISILRNKKVL